MSSGLYKTFDAGATYDIRSCECVFRLDATQANSLLGFIDTTARGRNVTLTLPSGSGMRPFGPDKNDTGAWTVSAEILDSPGVMDAPYLYFDIKTRLVNQSTHPAYSLPAELNEGSISIGTVDNVKFPQGWFKPENRLGLNIDYGMSGIAKYIDRGGYADAHINTAIYNCSQAKAAAIVDYLTGIARAEPFTLTTADNQYAFGRRSGGAGSYTVRLIQNEITIVHNGHDNFDIGLSLSREAIL
jgi:hypothetical protein